MAFLSCPIYTIIFELEDPDESLLFEKYIFSDPPVVCCHLNTDPYEYALSEGYEIVILEDTWTEPVYTIVMQDDFVMEWGDTADIWYSVTPNDGTPAVWSSSDPAVASVDDGIVTALHPGMARITLTVGTDDSSLMVFVFEPEFLDLPASLQIIESGAFASLPNVKAIRIPAGNRTSAEDAFDSTVKLIIPSGSPWIQWADDHGFTVLEE